MQIIEQFLVQTQYGLNMVVLTKNGEYYQQKHHTMCNEGGGIATWELITTSEALALIKP